MRTLWCLLLLACAVPASAATPAETFVAEAVRRGGAVDLTDGRGPQDRTISARFLEGLLTDVEQTVSRRGISIKGAIVQDRVDLRNAVVPFDVQLTDCVFQNDVDLSHSEWKRDLSLSGSRFRGLDVSYALVAGSAWLEHIHTSQKAYLSFLHVGRALEAQSASFDDTSVASFNSIVVGAYVRFDEAQFHGGVDLIMSSIGTNLYLSGTRFTSETSAALFDKIRLGEGISASMPAQFEGAVSFSGARVGRDLALVGSQFKSAARTADFSAMNVLGTLSLNRARFSGPAVFTSTVVRQLFTLDGAQFTHATIAPQMNLVTVDSIVRMVGATFAAGANLTGAHFGDDLNASGLSSTGPVKLYRLFIGETADLSGSTFDAGLDFSYANIRGGLNLSRARFQSRARIDFTNTEVGGDAAFNGATLNGAFVLNASVVKGDLNLEGFVAQVSTSLDLTDLSVARDLSLSKAHIRGDVELLAARIGGALIADGARFTSTDATISFDSVVVHGIANFSDAEFAGEVNLAAFSNGDRLDLSDAHFTNRDKDITCDGIKVGSLWLRGAVVAGRFGCQLIAVEGDIEAAGAKFQGTADFLQMRVKGDATFDKTEFSTPPTFSNSTVGGYITFIGTQVHGGGSNSEFSLNSLNVGRFVNLDDASIDGQLNLVKITAGTDILLRRATIGANPVMLSRAVARGNCVVDQLKSGGLDLSDGAFYNLDVKHTRFVHAADDLVLTRVAVERDLQLDSVQARRIAASGLRVSGTATLKDIAVTEQLLLDSANIDSLELRAPGGWKLPTNALRLHALSFREITTGDALADQTQLLHLIDQASYSPAIYAAFEQYYERQGMPAAGREVFVHYRRRAAREEGSIGMRLWSAALDVFVLFGKSPQRAFLYALLFVLVGAFVFQRPRMAPQRPEYADFDYSPVWYSLDRLIPVADLGTKNVWGPRQTSRLARNYMRIHILIGYVLITIGLAALTGLVR